MTIRLSVVTAVFNNVDTVGEALASVRAQRGVSVDHVVIDGGSTDGTLAVLEQARSQLSVLVSERDDGLYDALNKGIRLASGEVVGFLHADDELASPYALAQIANAFEDPAVDVVYGDLVYVRRHDPSRVVRFWRAGSFGPGRLAAGWMPPHPTFYVRRAVYERLGLFDTRFRIAADYESVLRILGQADVRAVYLPQVLVRMRLGGVSNRSWRNLCLKSSEDWRALRLHGMGPAGAGMALLAKNLSKLPQFVAHWRAGAS